MNKMPKKSSSYWLQNKQRSYEPLKKDIDCDICIVGGGIVGITSAYLLTKLHYKVVLIDEGQVLSKTTGHTSAKMTVQHGVKYSELIQNLGENEAKAYYEMNRTALEWMKEKIISDNLDCDYAEEAAYVYALTESGLESLEAEYEAYNTLGIDGTFERDLPFNIEVKGALKLEEQGRFHPVKYCKALLEQAINRGLKVYEETTAVNILDGEQQLVQTTSDYKIKANDVLITSHYPFYEGKGMYMMYMMRMYPERSYVLCIKPKADLSKGMYINVESPARSVRKIDINGESALLIVGEEHRTGDNINTMEKYDALYQFAVEQFGIEKIYARWSTQDMMTVSGMPYIGPLTRKDEHILVATGFNKWGMTNGTAAARLLVDYITKQPIGSRQVFHPKHTYILRRFKAFAKQNKDVVAHLVKGKFEKGQVEIDELQKNEAKIIRVDGERKGVYKNEVGDIFFVDTTCTHIGCEVNWNEAEKTWDCPCHGSRFSYDGEVLEGPAEKPLQTYDYKMIDNFLSKDSGY
ncbi:MAG TPA: FAD-dependent oxidoreductase [Pseudogracilibacillus sp.]|nr:FAD-dependent oxidoreductase [Pseudogracilibacillus sp.]